MHVLLDDDNERDLGASEETAEEGVDIPDDDTGE